jgi:hypothetical protein
VPAALLPLAVSFATNVPAALLPLAVSFATNVPAALLPLAVSFETNLPAALLPLAVSFLGSRDVYCFHFFHPRLRRPNIYLSADAVSYRLSLLSEEANAGCVSTIQSRLPQHCGLSVSLTYPTTPGNAPSVLFAEFSPRCNSGLFCKCKGKVSKYINIILYAVLER